MGLHGCLGNSGVWFARNDNCNCEKLRSSAPTYLLGLEDSRNKLNKSDHSRTRSLEVFAWQTYGALDKRIAFSQEWPHRTCRHRGIAPWCRIVALLRCRGVILPSHHRVVVAPSSCRCPVASCGIASWWYGVVASRHGGIAWQWRGVAASRLRSRCRSRSFV